MQELIKIQNEGGRQTVNARELHEFLEVGKDFSTWMKDRINQFDFVEDVDFVVFPEIGEKGGRPLTSYHLSLDMAKELSMVERNDKGKQARQYFIECERRALAPTDPIIMLRMEQLELIKQVAEIRDEVRDVIRQNKAIINTNNPKLTIGMISNPITVRMHAEGWTIRTWAEAHGFEYGTVRNVLTGLSQRAEIKRALANEGYFGHEVDTIGALF